MLIGNCWVIWYIIPFFYQLFYQTLPSEVHLQVDECLLFCFITNSSYYVVGKRKCPGMKVDRTSYRDISFLCDLGKCVGCCYIMVNSIICPARMRRNMVSG